MNLIFSVLSLIISGIALWVSKKSDNKMQAIADLNYDEKLAMFAGYLGHINADKTTPLIERINNDLNAVSNLSQYASDNKKVLLIRNYIIPIVTKIVSDNSIGKGAIVPLNQILEKAIEYGVENEKLLVLKQQVRDLK